MKVVKFDDPYKRKNIETCEELYNIDNHYTYITNLFHQIDFSYNSYIHKELRKKHSSYKCQDKKKNRYDESQHITYEELIKKIYDSHLKCYYCKTDLSLVYENKNTKNQWSLERFNNMLGHYESNTCISCLKCNLQRRNENHEYFKDSKQWTFTKVGN